MPACIVRTIHLNYHNDCLTCVTAVQSSGQVMSLHVPSLIMGSIVNVCPGLITPIALFSGGRRERERELMQIQEFDVIATH